jgi:sugar phosphate isomerase/epimerase
MRMTGPAPSLSLAHLSELDLPPSELMLAAGRAGFSSVGFRTNPAAPGGPSYPLATPAEQATIRQLTTETGVAVLYVELISLSEATRPADYELMIATGAAIGATRLAVGGDSPDIALVAEKMAGICDLARPFGIAVDLEFMPFRGIKSFADAKAVVTATGRPNAHILVDALHVFRSGSSLDDIRATDRRLIGTFQICDAPALAPPPDQLVVEARTRRLRPGAGGLDLAGLMAALPADVPIGVEVPLAGEYPNLPAADRLEILGRATRDYFSQRRST